MGVTHREVVAHWDMVFPQVLMEHVIHVREGIGGTLVTGKLSDDDTFDMWHQPTNLYIM